MKDLIAKQHSNAADQILATFSTLEMQLQGFAKSSYEKDLRIAELEAQIAGASAPAVEQNPNELRAWLSKLEDEVMPLHSDAKRLFTRVRTYLQACGYFSASTALQAPVREVPEGWQLVPTTPTTEMFRVGCEVHDQRPSEVRAVYSAMLAAAPVQEPKP